jgi:transposase
MLPADVIAEIIANLAALNLQPSTAAAVLGALAPLLRTAETPPAQPSRRPRSSKRPRRGRRKRKYKRQAPSEARDRALAALRANPPDASATEIAKIAKVSRSTVVKTRNEIEKAERKQARKSRETTPSILSKPAERRQRALHFLREQLARGPKQASVVEEAAAKAHIDEQALGQARGDLGIVTSRSNAGGVQAVQWSLPG